MDAIDHQIVELLKANSRISSSDISKAVHLSVPAVSERIRRLEKNQIIDRFTVKLNRKAAGQHIQVLISVQLTASADLPRFRQSMLEVPSVLECHHIAGEYDYLLKVALADLSELETFITDTLKARHSIARTNTVFILNTIKEE
ncbi:Lrp/AsnC family transcriptional regulator [Gorillibacterium sp. CAU 1737]|uniref:Lrp/AsnC family transcriptional regulator n=1 Tax=Gorillibacterium sp. CAU 1737 TaxID=3140362 RepID=UPI003260269D